MKPAPFDLNVTRGDDFVLPLNIRGRDISGNKTTISLVGYTLECKLVYTDGSTTTVTTNWIDQASGSLELFLSRSVTTLMPSSNVKWYFAVTDPSVRQITYMDGTVYVRDRGARQR